MPLLNPKPKSELKMGAHKASRIALATRMPSEASAQASKNMEFNGEAEW